MFKGINITALSQTALTNMNSGEGGSNTVDIKQYIKNNEKYPYVSGQAMRHYIKSAIRRLSDNQSCVPDNGGETCGRIAECELCDLFGYMTTIKGKGAVTRVSPIKVSAAMGLMKMDENSNLDLLTRKKINDDGTSSGDIVNVELSSNIYRYGISIDIMRIGAEEIVKNDDILNHTIEIIPRITPEEKSKRIKNVINGIRYITDYSKQSRLLTDFTPDIVLISLDVNYTHRLQKALELNTDKSICVERMISILKEMQTDGSKVLFGALPGSIANLEEVIAAVGDIGIECMFVGEAFNKAIELV